MADNNTYINISNLLSQLQGYDHTKDWYISRPSLNHAASFTLNNKVSYFSPAVIHCWRDSQFCLPADELSAVAILYCELSGFPITVVLRHRVQFHCIQRFLVVVFLCVAFCGV